MVAFPTDGSLDTLSTLPAYEPHNMPALGDPSAAFAGNKLNALKENISQFISQQSPPTTQPAPEPTPSLPAGFSWEGAKTPQQYFSSASQKKIDAQEINKQMKIQGAKQVSDNAYQIDPEYRAFVDHYKNGAMSKLPQATQDNFDEFALNMHYNHQISQNRMPDVQNLTTQGNAPDKKKSTFSDVMEGLTGGPITTAALGAKLMMNDWLKPFGMGKTDREVIDQHNRMISAAGSSLTAESALYYTSMETKFASSFLPPVVAAPLGALGGFGEATALDSMGYDQTAKDYFLKTALGAAVPLAAKGAAGLFTPSSVAMEGGQAVAHAGGLLGDILPQSHTLGRVLTSTLQGAFGAGAAGGTQQTGEVLAGRAPASSILDQAWEYGKKGAALGALFGVALEVPRLFPVAAKNMEANARAPQEFARKKAMAIDPESQTVLDQGVDPILVNGVQDSGPADLHDYLKQIDIYERRISSFGGTESPKQVIGGKITDALGYVVDQRKAAGKLLGELRLNLSGDATIDGQQFEQTFLDQVAKMGGSLDPKGNLSFVDDLITPKEAGALKNIWNSLPDGPYSPQQLDLVSQKVNDLVNNFPIDESGNVKAALLGLKYDARKALVPFAPEEYLKAMSAYSEGTDQLEKWARILKLPGEKPSINSLKDELTSGNLDLKAGYIAHRLATNTVGNYLPRVKDLEQTARAMGWQYDGNLINQVKFDEYLERYFGTPQTGSMRGIMQDASTPKNTMGLINKTLGLFGQQNQSTPFSKLQGLKDYINGLVNRGWTGSPEVQSLSQIPLGSPPEGGTGAGQSPGPFLGGDASRVTIPPKSGGVNGIEGEARTANLTGPVGEPDLAHMSLADYDKMVAAEKAAVASGMDPKAALAAERSIAAQNLHK